MHTKPRNSINRFSSQAQHKLCSNNFPRRVIGVNGAKEEENPFIFLCTKRKLSSRHSHFSLPWLRLFLKLIWKFIPNTKSLGTFPTFFSFPLLVEQCEIVLLLLFKACFYYYVRREAKKWENIESSQWAKLRSQAPIHCSELKKLRR